MPMTIADWESWTTDKREFYATLFTCYSITDGVLRIDTQRRQQHVQRQLQKQKEDGEQIINSSILANYILTNGLKDKKIITEDDVSFLCLQRPFKAIEEISSDPTASKHTLVGGFWPETQSREAHFERVVKEKMCGGFDVAKTTIKESAHFISLGNLDDFTVLSSCALHPEEKSFLFDDRLFRRAIESEAHRLSELTGFELSSNDLITKIRNHLDECSKQESLAVSLQSLSVPRVTTHWVLYSQKQFNQICRFVTGIEKDKFIPPIAMSLSDALEEGSSKFAFLSEYTNLLKIELCRHVFNGKSIDDINEQLIKNPEFESQLTAELERSSSTGLIKASELFTLFGKTHASVGQNPGKQESSESSSESEPELCKLTSK